MVFFFSCPNHPEFRIFMGRDKFENEDLIRWGHPEDIWFHVEHLSSAHVYVRTPMFYNWEELPEAVVKEMCQLTKHNSIEGSKKDSVEIVYTPWSNLKKTGNMDIGQVGFKNEKLVRHVKRVSKEREVIKRLEKTRTEMSPNFEKEKADRDSEEINIRRKQQKDQELREKEALREKKAQDELKSYASLYKGTSKLQEAKGDGTVQSCRAIEEDFM